MIPAVFHVDSKSLAFILDAAFRSLLLGCFLAVMLAAFRLHAVRAKLLAWRGLLLVAIAMPLLIWLSPALPLPIPVPSFSRNVDSAAVEAALPDRAHAPALMLSLGNGRSAPDRNSTAPASSHQLLLAPVPGFSLPPAPAALSWSFLAASLYLALAFIFLARLLIGIYFATRLRRDAHTIGDTEALILLASAARTSSLRIPPRLAESGAVAVPVTLGILWPAILLPPSWREWEQDDLAAVLAHEASHVARRDSLVQLLALFHRAIFWFSPLSWWLNRHLADLAEQASDEAALAGGADRTRYAQALAGFLTDLETAPARRVWWHGVAMAKTSDGEKRVDRILEWKRSRPRRANAWLLAAALATCLPAVALSVAAHPSPYDPQDIAAPPVPAPPPPQQLTPLEQTPVPAPGPVAAKAPPPIAIPAPPAALQPRPVAPIAVPAVPVVAIPDPPQMPEAQASPNTPAPPTFAPPPPPVPVENGAYPDDFAWSWSWPWAPQFAIVTPGSEQPMVSDSEEAAEHAGALRSKVPGDFIWFEHDGKSYIIRDRAIIDRAKQIWDQRTDSAKWQQQLQAKEQELSKEMREQVQQKMQEVRVRLPDMTAELEKLQSEVKKLNASGATMQQLGDLQRQVGELQQALGAARWNSNMDELTSKAGELGQQMGDIGRQLGEIARQSVEQARQSSDQMRQLFDSAIANGKAKQE
jgi:beta-lactamase regulating signal transducer with metallopeptidase domain